MVLAAGRNDSAPARAALNELCQTYWYPLYAFVRRRGHSPQDAQDLTQEFFARLLERNRLADLTREGGKFRSFLLTAVDHFLIDEWKKARSQRRGGGHVLSLDAQAAETRYGREPVENATPETLFERNWAMTLLDAVYIQLRHEYEASGKGPWFAGLRFCLTGARSSVPYAELAVRLGVAENTVKTAVHRLRRRFRELLRAEVAHTVASSDEVEEELRHLFRVLSC